MRYLALATDYDGTLATAGAVSDKALAALEKIKTSGRKLILVTGRVLPELITVFPRLNVFDIVIAENGALLYKPDTEEQRKLGEKPSEPFIQGLHARHVAPISVGQVIVATWQPHEIAVLELIKDLGLELAISFNKGAVMILP